MVFTILNLELYKLCLSTEPSKLKENMIKEKSGGKFSTIQTKSPLNIRSVWKPLIDDRSNRYL
jgi:hypothetical protein